MSLHVALQLSPEAAEKLEESIANQNAEAAHQILADAITPTVKELMKTPDDLTPDEFEALADQLIAELNDSIPAGIPQLSDYALSRESVYEDQPKF